MVALNTIRVDRYEFQAVSTGVDQTVAATNKVVKATDAAGAASERLARSSLTLAGARERADRQFQAGAREQEMLNRVYAESSSLAAVYAHELGRLEAQVAHLTQTQADAIKMREREVDSLGAVGRAFKEAGKFALAHPVLVLAASGLAARHLATFATSASASLTVASLATAKFANDNAAMGANVVTAAGLASRGLGMTAAAATASVAPLGAYSDKVSTMTGGIGLLARALLFAASYLGPIAVGLGGIVAAGLGLGKAFSDLQSLIDLAKSAEKIDVSAAFLKGFTGLGAKIRIEVEEMQQGLARAATFVEDKFGEQNKLGKIFGDLKTAGFTGGVQLEGAKELDAARTTEERIKAALTGMAELERIGLRLAAINIAETMFGPALAERMRQGQTSAAQIRADLEAASEKEVLKQEQSQRALDLSRSIEDVKRKIGEAVDINFNFANAGVVVSEIWRKILFGVLAVIEALNTAIAKISQFTAQYDEVFTKLNAIEKMVNPMARIRDAASSVLGWLGTPPPAPLAVKVNPLGGTEGYGPNASEMPKVAAQARAATAALNEATSAYENLIQRTRDRIVETDLETSLVGKNADAVIKLKLAHDLERAATKAGLPITEAMRSEWDKLGDSLAESTRNSEQAKRAFDQLRESQRALGDQFSSFAETLISGSGKIGDALGGLSRGMISGGLNAILTGTGPYAAGLGTAPTEKNGIGGILSPGFFDKLSKSVSGGTENAFSSFFSGVPNDNSKAGGTAGLGTLGQAGSVLMGGLAAWGAGQQAKSPLMGAVGGAISGLAAGASYGPIGAVAGVAIGRGALFGKPARKPTTKPQTKEGEPRDDRDQRALAA